MDAMSYYRGWHTAHESKDHPASMLHRQAIDIKLFMRVPMGVFVLQYFHRTR